MEDDYYALNDDLGDNKMVHKIVVVLPAFLKTENSFWQKVMRYGTFYSFSYHREFQNQQAIN